LDRIPLEDNYDFESGVRSPVQKIAEAERQYTFLPTPKAPSIIQETIPKNKVSNVNQSQMRVNFNYQGKASNIVPIYKASTHSLLPIYEPASLPSAKYLELK
jgi:hypothetical protein